jgi:hypothetical protein
LRNRLEAVAEPWSEEEQVAELPVARLSDARTG